MIQAPLFSSSGERIGEIPLPEEIFGHRPKRHVLWEAVKMYLANRRVGTHKAKTRGEVRGSGRKIWPQKHTGRARHGDRQAPIFVGGGKAHPPRPRDYSYAIPKKVKRLALKHALSDRAQNERILVLEAYAFERPKTRDMVALLRKLAIEQERVLILYDGEQRNLYLSARNIPNVRVQRAQDANAYDVLWSGVVVMDTGSIDRLKERLS
ncbi:MAG: 50S ribosomal protein L4 [Candidatus Hydrothermae bacterium]|nr:50S ribosomal protein L4 [Candidatus Hydrothermae bacterium]